MAPSLAESQQLRQTLDGLAGKVIGFIDNGKPNFNHLVDDLAELEVESGATRVILRRAENAPTMTDIAYQVPLTVSPDTYNRQPLWLAALGAPKTTLTPVPRESPRPRSAVHPSRVL